MTSAPTITVEDLSAEALRLLNMGQRQYFFVINKNYGKCYKLMDQTPNYTYNKTFN